MDTTEQLRQIDCNNDCSVAASTLPQNGML